MKKTALLFAIIFSAFSGQAQQTEYLFGANNWRVGGFGGPILQFANINGQFAFYNGGGGGAIINGRFFLGGYGMGLSSRYAIDAASLVNADPSSQYELDFGHGGLWLGYNFRPNKVIHFSISSTIGGGQYSIEKSENYDNNFVYSSGNAFVLIPTAGAEVNILPWFRIGATAGYQYVAGEALRNWPGDLNSPVLQLQFKFGYFATP